MCAEQVLFSHGFRGSNHNSNSRTNPVPLSRSILIVPFRCFVSVLTSIRPKPDELVKSTDSEILFPVSSIIPGLEFFNQGGENQNTGMADSLK